MFHDVIAANKRYAEMFHDPGVAGKANKGLAVLTCIDSRIEPLAMLGLAAATRRSSATPGRA